MAVLEVDVEPPAPGGTGLPGGFGDEPVRVRGQSPAACSVLTSALSKPPRQSYVTAMSWTVPAVAVVGT